MNNEKLEQRVRKLVKTASSVSYSRKVVCTIPRGEVVELNATIDSKIEKNALERKASYLEMKDEIIGGK